jgi:hypothetical protein
MMVGASPTPQVSVAATPGVVMLHNHSERAVMAVTIVWTSPEGRKSILVSDSYMLQGLPPVIAAGGSTTLGKHGPIANSPNLQVGDMQFIQDNAASVEVDAVLFADGEIAGPDTCGPQK